MKAVVLSLYPLETWEKDEVAYILRTRRRVDESLRAAFPARYCSMDMETRTDCPRIYFDSDAAYEQTEIEY